MHLGVKIVNMITQESKTKKWERQQKAHKNDTKNHVQDTKSNKEKEKNIINISLIKNGEKSKRVRRRETI